MGQRAFAHWSHKSVFASRGRLKAYLVRSPEVNCEDLVPVLLRELLKRARAHEASVRHKDVCAPKLVQRSLHDALAVLGGRD